MNAAPACSCGSALCPSCGKTVRDREGWGVIEFVLPAGILLALVSCWPAIFAHGYTDTGGWRWDIHSTVACSAWWGVMLLFVLIGWVNHRTAQWPARPPRGPLPVEVLRPTPPARPVCLHRNAVKVNSAVVPGLIWRCWCPDCESELPANWTRFCCGTQPETPHMYNCPDVAAAAMDQAAAVVGNYGDRHG